MVRVSLLLSIPIVFLAQGAYSNSTLFEKRKSEYLELRQLVGAERFREAMSRCKDLLERYPDYLYLYQTIAEIALYARDYDNTIAFLNDKIEYGPYPALSYYALGSVYLHRRDYGAAVVQLNNAIELGLEAPECFNVFEKAYEKLKGVDAAIRFFNTLCHRNPENPNYWYALALAYWTKQDGPRIIEILDKAITLRPREAKYLEAKKCALSWWKLDSDEEAGLSLSIREAERRGDVDAVLFLLFYRSLEPDAIQDIEEIVETAKRYGNFRWLGLGLNHLSWYKHISCDYDSAIYLALRASASSNRAYDDEGIGISLSYRFWSQLEKGELEEALLSAQQRYEFYASRKNARESTLALVDLARVYHEMNGDYEGLEYAIEALNRAETTGSDPRQLCEIHSILGMLYSSLGNFSSAVENQHSALKYAHSDNPARNFLPMIERELGMAYLNLLSYSKAWNHLQNALRISEVAGLKHEAARTLQQIGEFYLEMKDLDSAWTFFKKAIDVHTYCTAGKLELVSLRGLARVAEKKGDLIEASRLYKRMIGFYSTRKPNSIHPDMIEDFRQATRLLCQLGTTTEGGRMWKSRHEIVSAKISMPTFISSDIEINLESQKSSVPEDFQIRYNKLSRSTAEAESFPAATYSVNEREALVEYCVGENSTDFFLYLQDTMIHFSAFITRKDIQTTIVEFSKVHTQDGNADLILNALMANFSASAGHKLYTLLIRPIEPFVQRISHLIVIPDGALEQLPFGTLVTALDKSKPRDISSAKFLVERFEISYAGYGDLRTPSKHRLSAPGSRLLLAVGNPSPTYTPSSEQDLFSLSSDADVSLPNISLPGTEREVNALKNIFGNEATVLVGKNATPDAVKQLSPLYRIIHIATHARFDNVRPLYSTLFLSAPDGADRNGVLRAFELLDLDLHADLVVLSACNTGRTNSARGLSGFQSAFGFAGARSVVSTLWSVEDEATSVFMETFYYHLRNGERKSRALQLAQMYLIAHGKADPFYWGAFTLTGDSSPLIFHSPDADHWEFLQAFIITALLILCLLLFRILFSLRRSPVRRRLPNHDIV